MLTGAAIDDPVLAQAGVAAAEEAEILPDIRGSIAYKRELMRVCVRRALRRPRLGPPRARGSPLAGGNGLAAAEPRIWAGRAWGDEALAQRAAQA
jgi:hypothetical protein